MTAAAIAYRFYRDPERRIADRDGVIVSPADGEVLYVHESRGDALPVSSKNGRPYTLQELTKTRLAPEDAVVVGIGLSLLDVHVNRAPIAGRISLLRRFPGQFGSLRRPEMVFDNERATIVIDRADLQVAVVLIASRLVRRIKQDAAEEDSEHDPRRGTDVALRGSSRELGAVLHHQEDCEELRSPMPISALRSRASGRERRADRPRPQ